MGDNIGSYMKRNVKNIKKNKKLEEVPLETISFQDIDVDKLPEAKNVNFNNNLVSVDNIYKFIDLYFKQKNIMYTHLYNSHDKLLDEDIPNFLKTTNNIFFEKITKDKVYRHKFAYENISIKPPFIDMDDEVMFPQMARLRNLTYATKLVAKVSQVMETIDVATGNVETKVVAMDSEYPITNIPLMTGSKYCSHNIIKGYKNDECSLDPGGHYIVNGSEKVVMPLERMIDNRPLVFIKKDSSSTNYTVQVNSKSHKTDLMQIINIRIKKDNTLSIRVPILNEIPVFILMRALGIESDNDIINYCVYDHNDTDMINIIRVSLENSKPEKENIKIVTQKDALTYLTTKMRILKKYNETDKDTKQQEKILHLKALLEDYLLPHIEGNLVEKGFYIGYMINRLLQCYLGRIKIDDRDSFVNKRIDLPGQLILELFKQFYKKMLNECNKFFKKRNSDDNNPLNIINQIKPNIIEQGLKTALLTGAWGKKKGVAQMLQRLTYLQTLSSLRRINSPTVDASTNKLTSPRHLHPTILGPCCVTGDTEILLGNSVKVKRFDQLQSTDLVTTINKETLEIQSSGIHNYFQLVPERLVKIKTISGRELKCTIDHPILIKTNHGYQMIEAGKLKIGQKVIIKHMEKYLTLNKTNKIVIDSTNVPENYKSKLLRAGLLDTIIPQGKLEILARLSGYNVCNSDDISNMSDIQKDIETLGLEYEESIFTYLINYIEGIIQLCDNSSIREYLSGFYSAHCICNETIVETTFNVKKTIGKMTLIKDLLKQLDIQAIISCDHLDIDNYNIFLKLDQSLENLEKFYDLIGPRYMKNASWGIRAEYIKYNKYYKCDYGEFCSWYHLKDDLVASPIAKIEEIPGEPVYDFTTTNNDHSFVVNSIVTSNCFIETSEGHKVGLVKNLSLIGNVTVVKNSQIDIIKILIKDKVKNILDVDPKEFKKYTRVLLNGEIIGLTEEPRKLYHELKQMKYNGTIDPQTGISHDIRSEIECKDLRINCDTGRLYHPVLRVANNEILLSQEMIDLISIDDKDSAVKITNWNKFMMKFPGVIEYIDPDEKYNAMIAMFPSDVEDMRQKMVTSMNLIKKLHDQDFKNIVNRYDQFTYVRYTHCEIHPALLIGLVVSNIPFCECNQGPRNIYQYSQARQAMGVYATNYRDRLDISYILYHPQRPIVTTRTMKYIGTDKLPAGENCIVAIATYGGYNQEDSNIMNKSAIERGLFRSTSVKKYSTTIQKNQSTSQDDIFIKPDRSQVVGMRQGTYDKLNEKGYAPEETVLENGDILIGKVSPIQPVGNSNKIYKDSSEYYKSNVPGAIDKVYTEIYTSEGYEMRKIRVRSERVPIIGDKFCCYDGEHDVLTSEGWIKINELTIDHKVATLVNGNTLEYLNPIALQEYDYDGKMYVVDSNQVNLKVTPNHRMYVGNREGTKYDIELAEKIYGKSRKYLKNVENHKIDMSNVPKELKLNQYGEVEKYLVFDQDGNICHEFDIESWLIIFGIWIAEGSLNGRRAIHFAVHKQRVRDNLEKSCDKLNIKLGKYNEHKNEEIKNCYAINDINLYKTLEPNYGGSINKYLPNWVWYLSPNQSKVLIHGMMLGDGHIMKGTITMRYDTSSIKLRDDLQRLALHAGYSANCYLKYKAGHVTIIKSRNGVKLEKEETITSNADAWRLTIVTSQNNPLVNKSLKADKSNAKDRWEDFKGKVYCCTVPGKGVIYVRRCGLVVWCGNSRHGQKGTNGIQLSAPDMMFSAKGISPDIIINPNAIPSRMTTGQLIECLVGKVAALEGNEIDGTALSKFDIYDIKERLKKLGYEENGIEIMYNGMIGKRMNVPIFIGPTYYQRLKHMVADKIHSRARGPQTILTRQPPEGRSRDGGLRFGEMERDCMIAHGLGRFLKERLLETADVYHAYVCGKCGLFAQRMLRKDNKPYQTKKDIYFCQACKNYTDIYKIRIPYAFKLLLQELLAMNICPRIHVKKNSYE